MAAKRKVTPPRPRMDLPWAQLAKAQQNKLYTKALHEYALGKGPNPGSSGDFHRKQSASS